MNWIPGIAIGGYRKDTTFPAGLHGGAGNNIPETIIAGFGASNDPRVLLKTIRRDLESISRVPQ